MGRQGSDGRFVALDSWRGICALVVALFHFPIAGEIKANPLVAHGYLFVDFFFVLSGFVIAKAYEHRMADEDAGWRFIIRRFGRLWPLHAFMLGVFVLAAVVKGDLNADERHSVGAIWTNLALVHGLGVHKDLTWNGPSWSISVEAVLYLLFAFLGAMPRRTLIYGCLVATGLIVLIFEAPQGMGSTFDFGACRGLAGFFTGVLISRAPQRAFGTIVEVVAVLAVVVFVSSGAWMFLAPFVFGLAVYVFAGSGGLIGRTLRLKPLEKLGVWSYSIYMVHAAVVAAMWAVSSNLGLDARRAHLYADSTAQELGIGLCYLMVIVGISALTYRWVESPARDFFNRLASYRTGPAPA